LIHHHGEIWEIMIHRGVDLPPYFSETSEISEDYLMLLWNLSSIPLQVLWGIVE
jgi:hypothetical protein